MEKKERLSNFELMRIISMLMIVMWHLIFHGNLQSTASGTTRYVIDFLILFGAVHVNSFILLTGYFQCEKKTSLKKILNLILTVWFYKSSIAIIFYYFTNIKITKLELFKELLPIDMRDYWFVNCYIALYIISPYLNILIEKIKQKDFRNLLIVGFILFSIIPIITGNTTISNDGYTIINFIYLYYLGAYLKKFPPEKNYHFKIYSNNKRKTIFFSTTFILCIISFLSYYFSKELILSKNSLTEFIGTNYFVNYRSFSNPIIIIQTLTYFLFFKSLNIKSKFINKLAKNSIDVYLLHENYYIFIVIYKILKTTNWYIKYGGIKTLILIIIFSIIVYIICYLISIIKDFIFKIISKTEVIKIISNKITKFIEEY